MSSNHVTTPALAAGGVGRVDTVLWLLLCVFVFVLPLAEAPKNIAAGLYTIVWCARALWTRRPGGHWDSFDTAFALMLLSAAWSSWYGGYAGDLSGVIRVVGVAWVSKRVLLNQRERVIVMVCACAGLVVAICMGAVPFLSGHKTFLELPSVGHVNQSALYIALLACATLGWTLQAKHGSRFALVSLALVSAFFGLSLMVSGSRAAILSYLVFFAVFVPLLWRTKISRRQRQLIVGAVVSVVIAGAMVLALGHFRPQVSGAKLQSDRVASWGSVDHRMGHWRLAVEGWRQRPWLGWGPESFQRLDPRRVCAWRVERQEPCDDKLYATASHAHSLYLATLAERGLLGVAALLTLLLLWFLVTARSARQAVGSIAWVSSLSGLTVVSVAGLFNTTLRVEHGSLALLFLALWLSEKYQSRSG